MNTKAFYIHLRNIVPDSISLQGYGRRFEPWSAFPFMPPRKLPRYCVDRGIRELSRLVEDTLRCDFSRTMKTRQLKVLAERFVTYDTYLGCSFHREIDIALDVNGRLVLIEVKCHCGGNGRPDQLDRSRAETQVDRTAKILRRADLRVETLSLHVCFGETIPACNLISIANKLLSGRTNEFYHLGSFCLSGQSVLRDAAGLELAPVERIQLLEQLVTTRLLGKSQEPTQRDFRTSIENFWPTPVCSTQTFVSATSN